MILNPQYMIPEETSISSSTLISQVRLHPPVIITYNQEFCFHRHQPTSATTATTGISLSLPQLQGAGRKGNMNTWLLFLLSFSVPFLIKPIHNIFFPSDKFPPGPSKLQAIGTILWFILNSIARRHRRSRSPPNFEPFLRSLRSKFGPMFTLYIGSRPTIFIANRFLAHQALIQNGAVFSDRPPAIAANKIATSNQHTINSAFYGPTWRVLRRNLTSEILHPSRMKSYSHTRKWVLKVLLDRLEEQSKSGGTVRVMDHFQYAMFCLLVYMCFGDRLDHKQIEEIERVQRRMLVKFAIFNRINFWPRLMKVLFRRRWELFLQLRKDQEDVLIPLIRARKMVKEERLARAKEDKDEFVISYVDTLLDLQLPDEKRKLNEEEMVSLCNEFLNAGTDTTSTALQWIMANLVKYPEIQEKLFSEIRGVVAEEEEVQEEDLQKMPYLRAIILEGLRRHPPGHFVLPHAVTEDVVLDKYVVPKNGTINFMVAEIGWDPEVWEDPMVFKPERFLSSDGEAFDITGNREIKMMPFGVGRRICPGSSLAMLHLEYFVANLVRNYEWKAVDGHIVDLSEKQEFTTVMKNPLQAHVIPRLKTQLPSV